MTLTKLADAVDRIGVSIGMRLIAPNDITAAAAQEYCIAKEVLAAAETRMRLAREALLPLLDIPDTHGKHVVHDSPHATVIAELRKAPRRISEEQLVNMLCRDFNLTVEEARKRIDSVKVNNTQYVTYLNVALKQLP